MDPLQANPSLPRVIPRPDPATTPMLLIPALNEEGRVGQVVQRLADLYPYARIVVVDDGSEDATVAEATAAGAEVLSHPFHMGYGAALQTGYKFALRRGANLVVQMDGDGQHLPEEVAILLARMTRGDVDLVVGSRFLGRGSYRMPFLRRIGSWLFASVTSALVGRELSDPTSGFQALNTRTLRFYRQDFYPWDYPDADILIRAEYHGLRFDEVAVEMLPGIPGKSMHRGLRPLYYVYKLLLSIFLTWLTGRDHSTGAQASGDPP